MEISKDQIKQTLINLGYLQNEYLDGYVDLMFKNLHTIRQISKTQAHHIFPVAAVITDGQVNTEDAKGNRLRLERLKSIRKSDLNIVVNLSYKDHQLAHAYLTLCTDLDKAQQDYEAQATRRFNPTKNKTYIHRGDETLNVSADELDEYLANGWELGRKDSKRC